MLSLLGGERFFLAAVNCLSRVIERDREKGPHNETVV